jgi:hypothetical protein
MEDTQMDCPVPQFATSLDAEGALVVYAVEILMQTSGDLRSFGQLFASIIPSRTNPRFLVCFLVKGFFWEALGF